MENGTTFDINTLTTKVNVQSDINIPIKPSLSQNYPNPFNATTTIKYTLPESGKVSIIIYNVIGERVKNLFNTYQASGQYLLTWDGMNVYGRRLTTGIYFCKMNINGFKTTRKIVLLQ